MASAASAFLSLRLPTPSPAPASSSPSIPLPLLRQARGGAASSALVARAGAPSPLFNPRADPFLSTLAAASPEDLAAASGGARRGEDHLPFLEIFQNAKLMASPAQVERSSSSYSQHRPRRPPPDLPSLLLHGRIVYIGMPLVPAVTELVVAQLMYLEWMNSKEPVYIYINSTGTARDDGEPVGMESEGFAIYDAMMRMKTEIHTLCLGAAAGHACLVLAAGKKGKRYMFPHAKAMIQQPRIPSYGMMQASDVVIRAKEPAEKIDKVMRGPFYMDSLKAKEFGVIDKILWRGQEKYMADMLSPDEWDKVAGVRRPEGM
ncbi:ATP-dependent Clp protease proteolytic subunit-related protein 3, chloroplastic-like isoform X2 [Phragmites australis]|uniref:ATP-dependent Clp protease proteolytic subunit-related protein 3, chloroplastic-like isoform X2 n=1 Tax=Phragmites australis TaxID=29695 RepID=UPI002D77E9AD|nr:ATP-dependent Clp protease proteolytic subunit-related protein 3, chloroplastic-like isoform X2 [Phragmites australis]